MAKQRLDPPAPPPVDVEGVAEEIVHSDDVSIDAPPFTEEGGEADVSRGGSNDTSPGVTAGAMSDAPLDGRWIEVTQDGKTWVRARWYTTRMRMGGKLVWVTAQCWSTSEPARYAHRVENPIAWRWPEEAKDVAAQEP
jgi:hypothetical protein